MIRSRQSFEYRGRLEEHSDPVRVSSEFCGISSNRVPSGTLLVIHSCMERVIFDSLGPTHSIALVWACRWGGQSPRSHDTQSRYRVQGARQRDHFNLVVVVWPWSSPSVRGTLRYTQEQASALQPQNSGQQAQTSASASWGGQVACVKSTLHHWCGRNVLLLRQRQNKT